MNYTIDNGNLVIFLEGHLKTNNATAIKEEIIKIIEAHPDAKVVFDAKNLHFISSSGLRVLLFVIKMKDPEKVTVQNLGKGIYEIFEMTGFTNIMDVKKKIRDINIEGAEIIGQGQSSIVYRIGPEVIVKLYNTRVPLAKIQQEIDFSKKAFVAGIPTAISFDLVKCGDAYGAVFEMVDHADTVGHTLTENPEQFDSIMEKFVATYKTIHHTNIKVKGGFESLKNTWNNWADGMEANGSFTAAETAMLKEMITAIPERPTMVHCDFHAGNVMYQNNEIVVIDMADIGYGHPIFDLAGGAFHARYSYMVNRQKVHGMNQANMLRFWDKLLRLYFNTEDEKKLQEIKEMCEAFGLLRGALFPMKHSQLAPEAKAFYVDETRKHLFPHMKWAMDQVQRLDDFFEKVEA